MEVRYFMRRRHRVGRRPTGCLLHAYLSTTGKGRKGIHMNIKERPLTDPLWGFQIYFPSQTVELR